MRRALFLSLFSIASSVGLVLAACGDSTFAPTNDADAASSNDAATDGGDGPDSGRVEGGAVGGDDGAPPPTTVKHVFVTSTTYDGKLAGSPGADAKCNLVAQGVSLPGTYHAWISTESIPAITNVKGNGPWYLKDGTTLVFNNRANLLTTPQHAIDQNEKGEAPASATVHAWTGSSQNGMLGTDNCTNFTDDTTASGVIGDLGADQTWGSQASVLCSLSNSLVCFEE